jgi:hypothetical protein
MVGSEHMEQNVLAGEVAGIGAAGCKWGCRTSFDPARQGSRVTVGILEPNEPVHSTSRISSREEQSGCGREGGQPVCPTQSPLQPNKEVKLHITR